MYVYIYIYMYVYIYNLLDVSIVFWLFLYANLNTFNKFIYNMHSTCL